MKDKTCSQGLNILSDYFPQSESGSQNGAHSSSSDEAQQVHGLQEMHVLFSVL